MADFTTDACRKFYEHWASLRDSDRIPKADVPEISVFLDNARPDFAPGTYMIELVEDTVVVRLMGTGLVEQWGFDQTGKVVGSANGEGLEKAWYENAFDIVTQPCGMIVNSYFKSTQGRTFMIESIALPLASPSGPARRVVSYTDVVADLGYQEHPDTWLETPKILWLDLGHGCPADPPLAQ